MFLQKYRLYTSVICNIILTLFISNFVKAESICCRCTWQGGSLKLTCWMKNAVQIATLWHHYFILSCNPCNRDHFRCNKQSLIQPELWFSACRSYKDTLCWKGNVVWGVIQVTFLFSAFTFSQKWILLLYATLSFLFATADNKLHTIFL